MNQQYNNTGKVTKYSKNLRQLMHSNNDTLRHSEVYQCKALLAVRLLATTFHKTIYFLFKTC